MNPMWGWTVTKVEPDYTLLIVIILASFIIAVLVEFRNYRIRNSYVEPNRHLGIFKHKWALHSFNLVSKN